MAPKFIIRLNALALTLAICLASFPTPALASANGTLSESKTHVIKFYLDPVLVTNLEFAKTVLPKYVADMNTVLAKNTDRVLLFDPETDIILTAVKPQTNSAHSPLPTEDFEIWAHVTRTSEQTSYNGYAGMDISGAGVLAGLFWTRLYNPDSLSATAAQDYMIQLNNMLHELAHVFNAGLGEYYNLTYIEDPTGVAPLLNIDLNDPGDAFWNLKRDFVEDPLLQLASANTRNEYLASVRYSNLTAAVISGDYRNGIPSFERFTVQVLDENGNSVPSANIKVWSVAGVSNNSQLVFDGLSDENGQAVVPWSKPVSSHNAANFLRLIKVYKDGAVWSKPQYISIFDMDSALLVSQSDSFLVTSQKYIPVEREKVFLSVGSQDGWILESSENSSKGGKMNATATTILVGDNSENKQYRGILSFDTSSLPENAVITSMTVKVKSMGNAGTLPFKTHGSLYADMQSSYFGSSNHLQLFDFAEKAGSMMAAKFSPTLSNGWYLASLRPTLFDSLDMTGYTQFRLRFKLDDNNDKGADYLKLSSGNAVNKADRPQLVVRYIVP